MWFTIYVAITKVDSVGFSTSEETNGIAIGNIIGIVPQLVPVAKEIRQETIKMTAGKISAGALSPTSEMI